MSDKKIIMTILGLSLVILIGGVALASRAPSPPQIVVSEQAQAQVTQTSHNWGNISLNGGNVEKIFSIKNIGAGPLEIANVKTSCMCTEAQVAIDGQKSPFFGMHSNSSWLGTVEPGELAELLVIFDPAFHGPSGVGQITRIVSLETNDSNQQQLEFNLAANVTD